MKNFNYFYIICGESGTETSTIVKELTKRLGMKEVKPYTTRPKRYKTEDTYTFITGTPDEIDEKATEIAIKEVSVSESILDDNYYFTTLEQIKNNNIVIWDKSSTMLFKDFCDFSGYWESPLYRIIYIKANKFVRIKRLIQKNGFIKGCKQYRYDKIFDKIFDKTGLSLVRLFIDFVVYNNDTPKDCVDKIIDFIEKNEKRHISCDKKETDLKCLSCVFGYDDDGGIYCKFH